MKLERFVVRSIDLPQSYYSRFVTPNLVRKLDWSPVVLLLGPRQSGKTTLCKAIQQSHSFEGTGYEYLTFDDQSTWEYATDDPIGFVDQLPTYVILDEVQLVPGIFRALKTKVDEDRNAGRFLLTGSAQLSFATGLAEALVGRMSLETLYPLAQIEIGSPSALDENAYVGLFDSEDLERNAQAPSFVQELLDGQFSTEFLQRPRLERDLARRIVEGGYPVARTLDPRARRNWHLDYIRTIAQRDIIQFSSVRRIDIIPELARLAASQTSQLFNLETLGRPLAIAQNTIKDYISILQSLYILQYVPSWSNNRLKRAVKSPKLHFVDTGLACSLLNLDAESLWEDRVLFGRLVETFVLQEVVKQLSWYNGATSIFHYRDRDRDEVDLVIEKSGHGIVAIEVKTRASVRESDFKAIRKLKQASEKFIAGVVFYDGERTRSIDEDLYAVPISKLWEM